MTTEWKAADLTIVFATLLGPVLAVQAQRFIDVLRERNRRRMWIFTTLMTTRAATLSPEHVRAINSVPLEFNGKRGALKEIIAAWKVYMDHLAAKEMKNEVWAPKRVELLVAMLAKMAKFLGYDFDLLELKNEIYSPVAHGQLETEQETIRRGLVSLLKGEFALPMDVRGFPIDETAVANQKELQILMLAWLRGEATPRVRIEATPEPREPHPLQLKPSKKHGD